MITLKKDKCIPQKRKMGEPPDYICTPSGNKYYLSREDKKDYLYGGPCPQLCPLKNNRGSCPNVDFVSDRVIAKQTCESNNDCQFISNAVIDRTGPNYCVPKLQEGCVNLTESDYAKSDKFLTDSPLVCDRLNKGCIFNRGTGDNNYSRQGNPTCLRGCLGSKYWKNPEYIWGGGGTADDPFRGSYDFNDLRLGPRYLEAAPSARKPQGWGGPEGPPYFGHGKLPRSLGIAYTESRGEYSPPCNISEGDIGAFSVSTTGETLAGPGCQLTPPQPQYGIQDWSYTCRCPYLREGGEFRSDAWRPCEDYQLDQDKLYKRDVCQGCYIQSDPKKHFYGHCVLGDEMPDTESKLLGCIPDPKNPEKCRIKRIIEPTECPAYCSADPLKQDAWHTATQCSTQLANGCWKLNDKYNRVISLEDRRDNKQAPPFVPGPNFGDKSCEKKNTNYLCNNCSPTSVKTIGTATKYPNRSYCVIGGSETAGAFSETSFGDQLARKLQCPPTCRQCLTGFFNEPLKPVYNLQEATNPDSAFSKGILFIPWIGKQAEKGLRFSDSDTRI
jgi:hypothetical protein